MLLKIHFNIKASQLHKKDEGLLQYPASIALLIVSFFVAVLLAGCATQKRNVSSPVTPPSSFSESGKQAVPDQWWRSFDDPRLNALVDTALKSNFNLRTAWQRLREARAVVDRESAALFPSLDASAQAKTTPAGSNADQQADQFQLGLTAEYELDLWGRIRSAARAEQYRAAASYADYQTAALSLSAEIARTWYQLIEARDQLQLINQQIRTNQKMLQSLENRLGTGQVQSVDILRQRQLVASTRQQKSYAESNIQVLEHRLAVLLGRTPEGSIPPVAGRSLPDLPPLPQTGVPVELIRRRPDVRSAFNRLQAADSDLASAISSQYPRLTLTASATSAASNVENLFRDWALSVAGNLLAPIFYGGELSAEVNRMEAVQKQRLYEYGQTVLTAFREVEDALIREKKQAESIASHRRQIDLARQAYQQLRFQYFNGTSNYLDVLTALDEVQQLRRDLFSARMTLIEYRIALYRALAGAFTTDRELQSKAP